jgi:PAS domain S-box-containing protein
MMKNQPEPLIHRILVVDDNPSIHADFRKILCPTRSQSSAAVASLAEELFGAPPEDRPAGRFELDSAFQGQQALAMVHAAEQAGRPYSLAFMDVRMPPGWDGIETITQIWKEHPQIQVVICTAYSDYSWDEMVKKLGETESMVILKKPFDNVEVLQLAHTLTKKWAVTRQAGARMADLDRMVQQRTEELLKANQELQKEIQRRSLIESALRESEERFHRAFETVAVPLAIRPLDTGRYLDVNQSFVELCGYNKAEILGKTPEELNLLGDSAAYQEDIQTLRNGKKVRNVELAIRRPSGEIRQTLISISLLRLGDQSCLLAALQDVTEQKQLESQLRQSQKMEAIGLLAAGIAHDFNNLLTIIQGYASLQLARATLDEDIAEAFTEVKQASERAAALTRQLLAFSRQQKVQRRPLDLGTAINQIQSMLSRSLGETVRLQCQLTPNLPSICMDATDLDQVIMNLAVNARDAMPEGGKLSISASLATVAAAEAAGHPEKHQGDFVVLTVADTGLGMNPQTLSHIFEPFFTTKPIGRGTGLGLSSVYGIIKQHGGWVEVESQPGVGSTFRVFLPATKEAPQPLPAPSQTAHPEPGSNQPRDVIFVVEDESEVREFVTMVLSSQGYRVIQAVTGLEAIRKWKDLDHRVQLLFTDIVMPDGVSGTMLAQQLLQLDLDLKVVYTSGYSPQAECNGQVLREGVNFLPKPFTRDDLLTIVQNALGSRNSAAVPVLTGVGSC